MKVYALCVYVCTIPRDIRFARTRVRIKIYLKYIIYVFMILYIYIYTHAQRFLLLCQQISNNLSKNAFIRGDANVITRRRRLVIRKRFKRNWTSVPLPVERKETFFFPPLCQETRILPSMDKKKKVSPVVGRKFALRADFPLFHSPSRTLCNPGTQCGQGCDPMNLCPCL